MIQVIVRAIDILEFVASHGNQPVKLAKIAEHSVLSQPTCANIVKTLVVKNYLENVSRKEGYILGVNAYRLTGNVSYNQNLVAAAEEPMKDLVEKINETCLLAILKNNKRLVVHEVQANNDLQVKTKLEAEVYRTASGRILFAFLPEKERNQLVDKLGLPDVSFWPGIRTKNDLVHAASKIRTEQQVQTKNAHHIVGLALPIFRKNEVVAALSVYLPESRFNPKQKDAIFKAMQRTANKIKEGLGTAK